MTFKTTLRKITPTPLHINFYWARLYQYNLTLIFKLLPLTFTTNLKAQVSGFNTLFNQRQTLAHESFNLTHRSNWEIEKPLIIENFSTPLRTPLTVSSNTDAMRLFPLYLTFANGSSDSSYVIHAYWRAFFITGVGKYGAPYVDPLKLVQRWNHTYNLLYNLFYNQSQFMVFSNKTLKTESCAFNWGVEFVHTPFFRFAAPFFWLKNNSYGGDMLTLYHKVSDRGLEAGFVTDTRYHQRTIFFLRRCGIYTMGPVAYTANPWLLHYPVPVASSTLFTQYFFIKFVIYMKRIASYKYFQSVKQSWLV